MQGSPPSNDVTICGKNSAPFWEVESPVIDIAPNLETAQLKQIVRECLGWRRSEVRRGPLPPRLSWPAVRISGRYDLCWERVKLEPAA